MQSWAASVLLWAITSAGRAACAITCAIVKVLPEPVTPSRVWKSSPRASPADSSAMARGWSPVGWYAVVIWNGTVATGQG